MNTAAPPPLPPVGPPPPSTSTVTVQIKCPSLDMDLSSLHAPTSFQLPLESTVASLKRLIHDSWPGRPSESAMRMIRSGRLLDDDEQLMDAHASSAFRERARPADNDPSGSASQGGVSIHLVLRPDAWTEPLPRLAATRPKLSPKASFAASTRLPGRSTPETPSRSPQRAPPPRSSSRHSKAPKRGDAANDDASVEDGATSNAYQTLKETPPSMYRHVLTLVEWTHEVTHAEYTRLWHDAYGLESFGHEMEARDADGSAFAPRPQSPGPTMADLAESHGVSSEEIVNGVRWVLAKLLDTSVERDEEEAGSFIEREVAPEKPKNYTYQQIEVDGLPYLLRLSRTSRLERITHRLATLYARMQELDDLTGRLHRLVSYHELVSAAVAGTRPADMSPLGGDGLGLGLTHADRSWLFPTVAELAQMLEPGLLGGRRLRNLGPAGAAAREGGGLMQGRQQQQQQQQRQQDQAPRRHGVQISLVPLSRLVTSVVPPLLFLSFKLALLVYAFTRYSGVLKRRLICAAAVLYVVYEAWRLYDREVQREVRRRGLSTPSTRQPPQQQQGVDRNRENPAAGAVATEDAPGHQPNQVRAQNEGGIRHRANAVQGQAMPTTSSTATRSTRQLPAAPRAPQRFRARPGTPRWLVEQLAYVNLESEDAELGFETTAPPRAASRPLRSGAARAGEERWAARAKRRAWDLAALPVLLFVGTMVPDVEQARRLAIDERDARIRLERLRLRQAQLRRRESGRSPGGRPLSGGAEEEEAPQVSRVLQTAYAVRVLQARPDTAVGLEEEEEEAGAVLAHVTSSSINGGEGPSAAQLRHETDDEERVVRRAERARLLAGPPLTPAAAADDAPAQEGAGGATGGRAGDVGGREAQDAAAAARREEAARQEALLQLQQDADEWGWDEDEDEEAGEMGFF